MTSKHMFGLYTAEVTFKTKYYNYGENWMEPPPIQSQEFSISLRDGKGTTHKIRGIPTEITTNYAYDKDGILEAGHKDYEVTFLVAADYLEERGMTAAANTLREACK